jgi:hypothetical protein
VRARATGGAATAPEELDEPALQARVAALVARKHAADAAAAALRSRIDAASRRAAERRAAADRAACDHHAHLHATAKALGACLAAAGGAAATAPAP